MFAFVVRTGRKELNENWALQAVSYTHLDVYKRQAPLDAVFGFVSGLDWVLCLLSLCERAAKS